MEHLKQSGYTIRCEWGIHGIQVLRDVSDIIIIVDILSFSTAVDIALSRRATLYPFAGTDQQAQEFAQQQNAILATRRPQSDSLQTFTLSPSSLQTLPQDSYLVLPSPNGSTLSTATGDTLTIAGSLRNARAVATYAQTQGKNITVIPAGERFLYSETDTALRPALEDWLGAGAIVSYLTGDFSPEASTAKAIFDLHKDNLLPMLQTCSSGVELIAKGYADDIRLASQLNISQVVPLLQEGAYRAV